MPAKKKKPTRKQQQLPVSSKRVISGEPIPNLSPPSSLPQQQSTTKEFPLYTRPSKYSALFNSQDSTTASYSEITTKRTSQSQPIEHNGRKKRKKQWSTPIQQLQQEINLLGNDEDDEDDDETVEFKFTVDKPTTKTNNFLDGVSQHMVGLPDEAPRKSINKRRQSYNNRGKRASSIGNGFITDLHEDVPLKNYYKHINASLPDPDRMRQLLVWCSKRRLAQDNNKKESNTNNQTNLNIAKVIEEEITKSLMDKRIPTSWYNRENDPSQVYGGPKVMMENLQNQKNFANNKIFSEKVNKLKKGIRQWEQEYNSDVDAIRKTPTDVPRDIKKKQIDDYSSNTNLEIDTSIVDKLTESYSQDAQLVNKDLQYYLEILNHTVRLLHIDAKKAQLIQEEHAINPVQSYKDDFYRRNSIENYRALRAREDKSSVHWPYPIASLKTKDLLTCLGIIQTRNKD
ncbi:uncharacterized protein SPAPADRAFT_47807 [Spathaspora passalidarum NRRL Y-27907]|uniref:Kinetochore protein mis13 n=1 Tax=Spathaspora passalidarum (strain NRRL Y-27907 / 11-Y1) TaxID=619300 RepID=G3ADZ8_SPAPN|nr:uncharacterized protein SPAPADRAFT_47807 [Spathaspora passalidarum NRRL Y-27907]EGW34723.1 hypothetical protein SPAPADRAFT_47807 [Spathaspora passalidarum NRRL Y-27907]